MGIYALFIAGANFAAPIMSGFINDDQGWQWVLVTTVPPQRLFVLHSIG